MDIYSGSFKVALTGDSIIARKLTNYNQEEVRDLVKIIKEADVSFTNLEVLPNDFRGYPSARSDGAHFAAHSWVLDELGKIGFNLFSCANNHVLDYGIEGLLATLSEMENRKLSFAGIGRNLTEARMPTYFDFDGGSVGMIACTSTFFEEQSAGEPRPEVQGRPGVNPLRFDTVYEVTNEQLDFLRLIASALGIEQQRQEFVQLGFSSDPNDRRVLPFVDTNLRVASTLNATFQSADIPAVRTQPNKQDLYEICKWVKEAKARSQIVIVSLHAHEQGETREQPAEFIRMFAHSVIDEGADIVVGHGPHLLRGMEIYNGKPIFYSLGNFFGQNELVYKLPADSYKRFGIDQSFTPSEVFRIRTKDGKKGFIADDLYWQSIMPICQFEMGEITGVELFPIEIMRGKEVFNRGTPYLAKDNRAKKIILNFSELSNDFGTHIIFENGRGFVKL